MTVETNADGFAQQVRRYAAIFGPRHGRNLGEVVLDRARKLAYELYKQTRKVAPTQQQITADVQKQGWKIPKYFPDGRIGRGEPSQWAGSEIAALPKVRGRKSTARRAQEAAIRAQKPTLEQMQAFVIRERSKAIGFVSLGWLAAVQDLGGGYANVNREQGRAEFHEDFQGLNGEVDIINDTPGIVEVNAKHNVVGAAIQAQIADMGQYISDHLRQELQAA